MVKKVLLGFGLPLLIVGLVITYFVRRAFTVALIPQRSETVSRGDVEIKVVETGTIGPLKKVDVKSLAGGRISYLYVDEGQRVTKGQVLAKSDPQEIDSAVKALRSQLLGAEAHLASARKASTYQQTQTVTGIDQYVKALDAARARLRIAEATAKVQPRLTAQTIAIAQANLDAARSTLRAQQDSLHLLVASTHPQALVSAQAAYDQALAQADNAARNLLRQKQLLVKGFVAQQAVDVAKVDADVAQAHLRDVKEHRDRIDQANAIEEENARSQAATSQGQLHQAEASLAQAQAGIDPLVKARELESARAAYQQAQAQLIAARSGKTQDAMRIDDIAAADAEVSQLQNQLNQQIVVQGYTTIVAAMTGVITKRYVEVGDVITSGISSFSAGTPVFQIADLATMLVKINVNEVDIDKVRVGMRTEVTSDSAKGITFEGVVRKVAPSALGSGSSDSGGQPAVIRFPVEIRIDHANAKIKPGMTARCSVIVARRRGALRLPINCVQGSGSASTVSVVTASKKNGETAETVTTLPVTVGLRGDDFVEIVSGLKQGDKVRPNPYTGPPRKEIDMGRRGN